MDQDDMDREELLNEFKRLKQREQDKIEALAKQYGISPEERQALEEQLEMNTLTFQEQSRELARLLNDPAKHELAAQEIINLAFECALKAVQPALDRTEMLLERLEAVEQFLNAQKGGRK